jgi:ABC-type bacteriocin/lantibiotic exporter with double-glycine peptidase domain
VSASLLSSLDLSRFYSYVPQQPFLIDGTIFQNIIFGKEERLDIQRDDNIISALEKSCCKEFVDKLEDGLEATVGENGIKLSLGQRQRLSLARALYRNSKLLVMDEPTSALDPKIEEEVILNLCKYFKDITIIMVTHKYDILKKFDTVYKLEHKKLIKVKKI